MTGPVGLSLSLGPSPVGGASSPSISGVAYPGETLTVSGGSGDIQWRVDGDAVTGETGSTYVVSVNDIGKAIDVLQETVVTLPVTCWHPRDEPGVSVVMLANKEVYNAIDPEVEATDGQTVRRWVGQTDSPVVLNQSTGAEQPLRQVAEVNGNDTVQFDGSNDFIGTGSNSIIRNKSWAYLIAACADTNRTGGNDIHAVLHIGTNFPGAVWIGLNTRAVDNVFRIASRRQFSDSISSATAPSADGYHVLTGECRWAAGSIRLRVDGETVDSDDAISAGNSQDSNSAELLIGSTGTRPFPGHVAMALVATPDDEWTPEVRSRIERYAGLLIGKNIPLVEP